ncbi:AAA family ATPase [Paenibacillus sp. HJL G12]|uniref:AAA family ATPase n=1 Tax=Paenibacillus dendrobii TaxID=2691084 RepID=A0A7X3IJ32_9BACL|nr:ATP-binding protein [Paenibacillus dendrobii]MWV44892.1 AAA family ATPase [Paenibacillus dendrobii]
MIFDIFNPQVSVVSYGLEGKTITIYGSNNLGKTKQATRMKKPFYLGFEKGIKAIAGVNFLPVNNWADFKKINKQLTSKANLERAKEMYQTIIFDEVEASARYCSRYVCDKFEVETIAEGRGGYGLWKEYEMEYWEEIDKLLNAGYTVVFIAHETFDEKRGKIVPKGDKRAIAPVIDNSEIVVYLRSNGIDEKGNVIKSSGYMAETKDFFARSKLDYINPYLQEFTAENLENAVIEAIKKQEEAEGIKAVSYEEQKETLESESLDFDELKKGILKAGQTLYGLNKSEEVNEIIEKNLGKGKKVTDFAKSHVQIMSVVLGELNDILKAVEKTEA